MRLTCEPLSALCPHKWQSVRPSFPTFPPPTHSGEIGQPLRRDNVGICRRRNRPIIRPEGRRKGRVIFAQQPLVALEGSRRDNPIANRIKPQEAAIALRPVIGRRGVMDCLWRDGWSASGKEQREPCGENDSRENPQPRRITPQFLVRFHQHPFVELHPLFS